MKSKREDTRYLDIASCILAYASLSTAPGSSLNKPMARCEKYRIYCIIKIMKEITSPLVSVVIPVYNGSLYLEETITSVIINTYTPYEIILVDDGSTDTSATICQKLASKHKEIRFFGSPKNHGLSKTLNFAIHQAKGKYIARINQDDLMLPDRLIKQVAFLGANPNHVAIGGSITLFTDTDKLIDTTNFPITDEEIKKRWLYFSPFADPAVMYRKSSFEKTDGYIQDFWPVDDVHMWYQLGKLGKLANLPDVVTYVRWHTQAGSIKNHKTQTQKLFKLHLWAAKNVEKPSPIIWIFWLAQYFAGYIFPAQFNWWLFRQMRKIFG